jgi:CheY-like chemotaxis protein
LLGEDIELVTRLERDAASIKVDSGQLDQVIMNLAVNARDAMPDGGTLSMTADTATVDEAYARTHLDARPGTFLRISVEDTGCGISPEILERVFDPFFTTKSHGQGTGLGLSTALGIVRSHAGFLHVDSHVGRGTRFTVFLPALAAETHGAEGRQRSAAVLGKGELILVVEQDKLTLRTAQAVLKNRGYRVLTASGGAARETYEKNRGEIRAVLLETTTPDVDVATLAEQLRQGDPQLPILASCGWASAGPIPDKLTAQGIPLLRKPYSDEQLLTALTALLNAS